MLHNGALTTPIYWAGEDAFTAYSHCSSAQRGTARGVVGGDTPGKDTVLSLCTSEGSSNIENTILNESKR